MKLFKVGEWRAWTDEECAAFEARWPVGTMERRAYLLALYTGQRKGDLVLMTRAHRKDGAFASCSPRPARISDTRAPRTRRRAGDGRAHEPAHDVGRQGVRSGLFWRVVRRRDRQGRADRDCVLHGLRKTAARRLAECGCSEEQIKAVTGHATSRMVAHYTKGANQLKLATAAILKLEKNG